jgi:hypothetical protein
MARILEDEPDFIPPRRPVAVAPLPYPPGRYRPWWHGIEREDGADEAAPLRAPSGPPPPIPPAIALPYRSPWLWVFEFEDGLVAEWQPWAWARGPAPAPTPPPAAAAVRDTLFIANLSRFMNR